MTGRGAIILYYHISFAYKVLSNCTFERYFVFQIHEQADDLGQGGNSGSLASGNAGARIACCVITAATCGTTELQAELPTLLLLWAFLNIMSKSWWWW